MIPLTVAGRLAMIFELTNDEPYINEVGELVTPYPLLTKEEARELLCIPPEDNAGKK